MFLGLPYVAYGGIFLFILLMAQILIGTHAIKVDFKYHKLLAWIIIIFAAVHGLLGFIYIVGK